MPFKRGRAAVVVLGDVGRSPRMQYHALSLAEQAGLEVDVIGYGGSEPHAALVEHPRIHLHLLGAPFTRHLPRSLYLVGLPLKLFIQVVSLLCLLCFTIPAPDFFILQNPPTIPTFSLLQLACWLRGAQLVIDWHNFGFTLLGLTLGTRHPLVRIHRWYERRYGRFAAGHLCVTRAMQHELAHNWGIRATVLYDRPPAIFRPITLEEKHELFLRLHGELTTPIGTGDCCGAAAPPTAAEALAPKAPASARQRAGGPASGDAAQLDAAQSTQPPIQDWAESGASVRQAGRRRGGGLEGEDSDVGVERDDGQVAGCEAGKGSTVRAARGGSLGGGAYSVATYRSKGRRGRGGEGEIALRRDRPAVIVSSTSWTADEDFGILLEAATLYDRRVAAALGEIEAAPEEGAAGGREGEGEGEEESHGKWKGEGEREGEGEEGEGERGTEQAGPSGAGGVHEGEGSRAYPRLLFLITGKGPLRARFEERVAQLRLRRVAFRTLWLPPEAYPRLLGAADLGLSLHCSSSGLDLPMKVVDMFGAGLPVAAMAYSCIGELVQDGHNGVLFSSSFDLADLLLDLFRGFPGPGDLLTKLRLGALEMAASGRWTDEWGAHVLPLLTELSDVTAKHGHVRGSVVEDGHEDDAGGSQTGEEGLSGQRSPPGGDGRGRTKGA